MQWLAVRASRLAVPQRHSRLASLVLHKVTSHCADIANTPCSCSHTHASADRAATPSPVHSFSQCRGEQCCTQHGADSC